MTSPPVAGRAIGRGESPHAVVAAGVRVGARVRVLHGCEEDEGAWATGRRRHEGPPRSAFAQRAGSAYR
jgi:hypothetical protein